MFFHRHQPPRIKIVQWAFLDLLVLFVVIATHKPSAGLAGVGSILVLASLSVVANKRSIYQNYRESYQKPKNRWLRIFTQTNQAVYKLNVYLVWPLIFFLGLAAIYASLYVD
jgi:hypothetical protein